MTNLPEKMPEKITEKNNAKKIIKMSFEEALQRLEEISQILSSQKINLEQMIDLYEEGTLLKDHCNSRLEEAKLKIEKIEVQKNKTNNEGALS